MENTKRLKARKSAVIMAAAYLALGVLMLVFPQVMQNLLMIILGLGALIYGIIKLIISFAGNGSLPYKAGDLLIGIVMTAAGAAVLIFRGSLLSFIPLIFGVFLVISAVEKVRDAMDARFFNSTHWWFNLALGILSLIFGIILVLRPGFVVRLSFRIIGIFLTIDGASGLISALDLASSRRVYRKSVAKDVFDAACSPVEDADFKEAGD